MDRQILSSKAGNLGESFAKKIYNLHSFYLEGGDAVNALQYWDSYLPYYFRNIVCKGHDFTMPSIISSFMPKSGGTYLHNRMIADLGYKDFWWGLTDPQNPSCVYASVPGLVIYGLGGFTCHTHFTPRPQVLQCLDSSYYHKIWVHLRNPVDCTVAGYHHYLGQAQGRGEVLSERLRIVEKDVKRLNLNLTNVDAFSLQNIDFFSGWAFEWLAYANQNPGRVLFSYFDELGDPKSLIQRVIDNYGDSISVPEITLALDNDRRRDPSEVRETLSVQVRDALVDKVARYFEDFEERDRLLTPTT